MKGFKTKSLEGLSYPMLVFLGSGLMLWLSYGLHLMNFAIILANTISVIFIITLIIMKFYFSKKTDRV
ncbi:MAG: SemiSWEET family transporter [Candidatus Altiarchaeales archaeon]|nr:SemiSWEET family transporter [Candidatus Altiarchaeales archaeon]